jgi:hypothetical protein
LHESAHEPLLHAFVACAEPAPHVTPQALQLFESACKLAQTLPHTVLPGTHAVQVPCVHTSLEPQALPHAPQFLRSLATVTSQPFVALPSQSA